MNTLEQLFSFGHPEDTIEIKGVNFTLTVLSAKQITDALNASSQATHKTAELLSYKQQVLARAITAINGVVHFADITNPQAEEIVNFYNKVISKLHYSVINALHEFYEKLDDKVNAGIEEEVKKSQSNRGV